MAHAPARSAACSIDTLQTTKWQLELLEPAAALEVAVQRADAVLKLDAKRSAEGLENSAYKHGSQVLAHALGNVCIVVFLVARREDDLGNARTCLLYTSPSPRD